MHLFAPVPQILRIKPASAGNQKLSMRSHKGVFEQNLVQLVGIELGFFKHIDKPVAQAASLARVESGYGKGIFSMGKVALGFLCAAVL
ncbi:hypothetical protein SDC9_172570 [bioreactor metagenome]|uniref:Uncharacterized protein n=1 Tax=bioreactor metagenome TaxID=1076179 RepID=A0A645GN86_9ZZZZ